MNNKLVNTLERGEESRHRPTAGTGARIRGGLRAAPGVRTR